MRVDDATIIGTLADWIQERLSWDLHLELGREVIQIWRKYPQPGALTIRVQGNDPIVTIEATYRGFITVIRKLQWLPHPENRTDYNLEYASPIFMDDLERLLTDLGVLGPKLDRR